MDLARIVPRHSAVLLNVHRITVGLRHFVMWRKERWSLMNDASFGVANEWGPSLAEELGGPSLADELQGPSLAEEFQGPSPTATRPASPEAIGPSDALLDECSALCTEMDVSIALRAPVVDGCGADDADLLRVLMQLRDDAQECGALLHECRRQTRQLETLWQHRRQELDAYVDAAQRPVPKRIVDTTIFWNEAPFYASLKTPECAMKL